MERERGKMLKCEIENGIEENNKNIKQRMNM